MSRRWRGVGQRRGEFFPVHRPTQVAQGAWRWFADTAADPQLTDALAAEQVVPQLTGAQVQNVVLRLRVQLRETTGAGDTAKSIGLQYNQSGAD